MWINVISIWFIGSNRRTQILHILLTLMLKDEKSCNLLFNGRKLYPMSCMDDAYACPRKEVQKVMIGECQVEDE
jgi:hypothetical protein